MRIHSSKVTQNFGSLSVTVSNTKSFLIGKPPIYEVFGGIAFLRWKMSFRRLIRFKKCNNASGTFGIFLAEWGKGAKVAVTKLWIWILFAGIEIRRTCGNLWLHIPWLYQDDLRLWAVLDEFFEALYKRRSSFVKKEAVWAEDDVGGSFQVGSNILVPLQDSTDGFFLKLTVYT